MAFFVVSLVGALVLIYIVGKVWFAGTQSRYLIIFFLMGAMASVWAILNGLTGIVPPQIVQILQPMWMVFVCCLPFLMLLYIMHFVNARLADSRILTGVLIFVMLADVALLLTNPLHHLYYTSVDENGMGVLGPFFWLHSIASYAVLATAFALLILYLVKNVRKYPHLILVALGSSCPFIINILYVFGLGSMDYDLTPLGFIIMFSVYGFFSIRFRLFNLKSAASEKHLRHAVRGVPGRQQHRPGGGREPRLPQGVPGAGHRAGGHYHRGRCGLHALDGRGVPPRRRL